MDPYTVVITAISTTVLLPLLYFLLRKIRNFLKNRLQYIVEGVLWHSGRLIDRRWASKASLAQYTRAQLNSVSNRYLHVPGTDIPFETDDVYIPLTLDVGTGSGKRYSAATLLEAGNRLIVVGDPGSGKSTLLKVLLRQGCRLANSDSGKMRLPVLLQLKDLTHEVLAAGRDPAEGLLSALRDEVGKVNGYEMGRLFDSYLNTVGLLVLLDGLDEVSTSNYSSVADALRLFNERLGQRSPESVLVLTMRTHFYHKVREAFAEVLPVTLFIQEFSPSDIYDFLKKWPAQDDAATHIGKVYAQLTDSPGLRDLCTNPLILAMYVANYQSTHAANLPDTRTHFYRKVMDELLVARRSRQLMVQARESLLGQRETVLGRLAFENLMNTAEPANSISWDRAVQVVSEVTQATGPDVAEASLWEIIRDTGIISPERPRETLRFNHLSFCEFLAARECTEGREDGWTLLLKQQRTLQESAFGQSSSRLTEVIPFTAALMKRVTRTKALEDVAQLGDRVLLMRCLLETQSYNHPSCDELISKEAEHLCSFEEQEWDEEWLRRLQLFIRLLRDAQVSAATGLSPQYLTPEEFFNRLINNVDSRLLRLFSQYASQDSAAALRLADHLGVDLVQDFPDLIVRNCDNPAFRAMAVDRANAPGSNVVAWSKALTEAGLQFQVVALSLHELKQSGAISAAADRVRRRRIWFIHKAPFKRLRSLYTDCITVACDRRSRHALPDKSTDSELAFVSELRKLRAPGQAVHPIVFYFPFAVPIALILLVIVVGAIYIVVADVPTTTTTIPPTGNSEQYDIDWGNFLVGLVQLIGVTLLCLSYVMHPAYRSVVYQRLINVYAVESNEQAQKKAKFLFRLMSLSLLQRVVLRRPYRLMSLFENSRSRRVALGGRQQGAVD